MIEAPPGLLVTENRWFIAGAMVYLVAAGAGMAGVGSLLPDAGSRPALVHLFTLGFLLMLVYGLGAHMLPRFTGNPIARGWLPWAQMALAHLGLLAFAAGWGVGSMGLALVGGGLVWLSLLLFAWRVLTVLWRSQGASCPGP